MTTIIQEPGTEPQVFVNVGMESLPEWSESARVLRYWSEKHPCGWAGGFLYWVQR